jgi:hypothetical protein
MAAGDAVSLDGQYEFWGPNGQAILMGTQTAVRVLVVDGLLGLADIKPKSTDRDSSHGAFYGGPEFMGGRVVTMELALEGTDTEAVENLIDRFHAAAQSGAGVGVLTMKRRNKVKRVVFCKIRKSMFKGDYDVTQGLARGAVELFAADPRVYSATAATGRVTPGLSSSGRTYPRTYNYSYGALGVADSLIINNAGNIPMYPIVRIYGPCSNPSIRNVTTQQSVDLTVTLLAGQYIELDMDMHSALFQGTSAQLASVDIDSSWWALIPGNNEIKLFTFGGDTTCYAEVDWRSSWANG